jgi:hypothetical protein
MHRCLFGEYAEAIAIAERLAVHLPFAGFITVAECNFFRSP